MCAEHLGRTLGTSNGAGVYVEALMANSIPHKKSAGLTVHSRPSNAAFLGATLRAASQLLKTHGTSEMPSESLIANRTRLLERAFQTLLAALSRGGEKRDHSSYRGAAAMR